MRLASPARIEVCNIPLATAKGRPKCHEQPCHLRAHVEHCSEHRVLAATAPTGPSGPSCLSRRSHSEASHAAPHAVLACQLWILGDPKPRRHLGTAVPAGCRYVQSNLTCTFSCEIQGHFWPSCSRQGSYRSFMSPTPKQEHCLKSKIMKPGMELDHKEEQPKPSMWALLP